MSLQRSAAVLRRSVATATPVARRTLTTSNVARAEAHHGSAAAAEEYPAEGFSAPIWRNSILLLIAGFGIYRFSALHAEPHSSRASSSGRSAPGNESEDGEEKPFITRYIAQFLDNADEVKERNTRHLDLVRQAAEDKLLFQDAELPPVRKIRFAGLLDQASPHRIPVGHFNPSVDAAKSASSDEQDKEKGDEAASKSSEETAPAADEPKGDDDKEEES